MKITQDPHFDQRFIIAPTPYLDMAGNTLFTDRSMTLARSKARSGDIDDFWFHGYAARRMKGWGDTKPLLDWLRTKRARHVWQPVAHDLIDLGSWDGRMMKRIAISRYSAALIILDRDRAAMFKMNLPLFTEPDD